MSELVECLVAGGVWVIGTLELTREQFEGMTPQFDGTFNIVFNYDGFRYYYDGIVPEYDFTKGLGLKEAIVRFNVSTDNIVGKWPA
jgi:hypothetical protein